MTLESLGYTEDVAIALATLALEYPHHSLRPARVVRQNRGRCLANDGETTWSLDTTVQATDAQLTSDVLMPVVGDWVGLEPLEQPTMAKLLAVLPRRNCFARKVPGKATQKQVIAANVDRLLIVVGLDNDFSVRRVERYLTALQGTGIEPVMVLNKADLHPDACSAAAEVRNTGAMTLVTSATAGDGMQALFDLVEPGKTLALAGSSGVGKSTIVNALAGAERQAIREVRSRDQRGQHTTTTRELIELPGGGILIDMPGMRELQLWADDGQVEAAFSDIALLASACRYRDCQHSGEPGCEVAKAVERGELDRARFESYQKQLQEVARLEQRQNQQAKLQNKAQRRNIAKRIREYNKNNRNRT